MAAVNYTNVIFSLAAESAAVAAVEMSGIVNRIVQERGVGTASLARGVTSALANELAGLALQTGNTPLLKGDFLTYIDDALYYSLFQFGSYQLGTTGMVAGYVAQTGLSAEAQSAIMTAGASLVADVVRLAVGARGAEVPAVQLALFPAKSAFALMGNVGSSRGSTSDGSGNAVRI